MRELAVASLEKHASARQCIEVRRLCRFMTVATERPREIVGHQEQDIRSEGIRSI